MNTRQLIAASALTFGITFGLVGNALAQEATPEPMVPASSTVNRAEMRADAAQALARGELSEFSVLSHAIEPTTQLSREAVRTATLRALKDGRQQRIDAEAFTLA